MRHHHTAASRHTLSALIAVFTIVFTLSAAASDDLFGKPSPPSDNTVDIFTATDDEPEFLRVEQAYQATLNETSDSIIVDWKIHPGYYLYQHQFKLFAQNGDGKEELSFTSTEGKEKYDEYFAKNLEVHYKQAILTAELPTLEKPYEILVRSQGCADAGLCYPPRKQYFKTQGNGEFREQDKTSFAPPKIDTTNTQASGDVQTEEEQPLLIAVLFGALLGGLILNLMPCVFPVLSLKALSFASTPADGHKQHWHGWAYTMGVVLSFLAAAAFILVARNAGEALGWGFQLQQPNFVAAMTYLFLVMGLSLSGIINIGTQLMGVGNSLTSGHSYQSSFFTGVLAALVASPCTAPFMATALGFALTQPAFVSLSIFTALGFGMALPFLLLSYSPALANFLPKPGAWMETLKQCLAFPLYLTCVWLLYVLANQASIYAAAILMAGGIFIAFAGWLTTVHTSSNTGSWVKRGFIIVSLLIALFSMPFSTQKDESHWQTYSPEVLEELRNEGKPVFVNLTADWCITCKVNERVSMNSAFKQKAKENNIVLLKGDWTNPDPEITALLEKYNRNGVPLYLMYPAKVNGKAEVLPQVLSMNSVVDAMDRAIAN